MASCSRLKGPHVIHVQIIVCNGLVRVINPQKLRIEVVKGEDAVFMPFLADVSYLAIGFFILITDVQQVRIQVVQMKVLIALRNIVCSALNCVGLILVVEIT